MSQKSSFPPSWAPQAQSEAWEVYPRERYPPNDPPWPSDDNDDDADDDDNKDVNDDGEYDIIYYDFDNILSNQGGKRDKCPVPQV